MITPLFARNLPAGQRRADSLVVVQFHLLLAVIVLARFLAELESEATGAVRSLFFAFGVYSLAVFLLCRNWLPVQVERTLLYLEVFWLSLMVFHTGGTNSPFFPFYVFSVMIAAFRFGKGDGSMLALAATLMYGAASVAEGSQLDLLRMVMRGCFLLTLGSLVASLGEANLRQHRRLALLRDINSVANPRFGIDRTVADVMERCRVHFGADVCLLVARRAGARASELRIAGGTTPATPQRLPADAPLARLDPAGTLLFDGAQPAWNRLLRGGPRLLRHDGAGNWPFVASAGAEEVGALCDARSFISVPISFRGGVARLTVCATARRFERDDALFLEQVVAQVLPAIENVYLLDRMATMAAVRERRSIAHDLHDSAIQPYIGLNASLAALRRQAAPDNPLRSQIEELATMSAQVITDLRHFAGDFNKGGRKPGLLIDAPLRRQLLRAKQWYNVDIRLDVHGADGMGDRLSAAVLQLSEEGISNICKHTQARRASLRIACDDQVLRMDIENDAAQPVPHFIPRSIAARASALGGYAAVEQRRGATVVRVAIPV